MTVNPIKFEKSWRELYLSTLQKHGQAKVVDDWLANFNDGCCCDGNEERYSVALGAIEALLAAGFTIEPGPELLDKIHRAAREQA